MNSIYQLFQEHVKTNPNKAAVIFNDNSLSYQQLDKQVGALSSYFTSLGLRQGHRVALFAPNGLEYPTVMLAAAKLGLAIVPLPISLKGDALITALKVMPVAAAIAWPTISKVLLQQRLVERESVITIGDAVDGEQTWQATLTSTHESCDAPDVDTSAPYILTMTSGSTGQPKPIVLSQRCKIERAFAATIDYYCLNKEDVVLVATPLYHSLAQRGVLMPLMLGATTVIMPKFSLPHWLKAIEQHAVSFLFAVSAQLESFLVQDSVTEDISSIRCLVSSSAVLNNASKKALMARLDCDFHECYGASEVGVVTDFCVSKHPQLSGSVGKALPFVEVKITDKRGHTQPNNEIGEICCKTTTAFNEYFKMPEATANAYDSSGFFRTGDLGYLDEHGYLYYVGRKKEVISSGGINVFPQDIEAVVKSHPMIIDCVAFGCQHPQLGEYVKVVYERRGEQDLSMELRKLCLKELTDYQQPREFLEVAELLRNPMGKVLRNKVKELYKS
ncbi:MULTISPECIES: class I adenylate-forming enzyme family protein [Pseudoalteromonas]|uniref:AMP-dependent synthetase n=1 Tax=Pseudoalteromonas amylolytica TaxID=1859457 RepID=A0A1S1MQI6_9GAMM|nr:MULTISPECIES: class I adenylate-forming enzyme family protein [Pseudoalteromonas]OHU87572.1 AMP-dependent synthetase [Pseudoalteromonas sp. JW3]OHU91015.1 AMP-dependent synthetase [Pseudoalteromonas amylolytica]